jgi:hypothetical protein
MYKHIMIRKQLYITEAQDLALKHRSAELGMSQAELVRRGLELVLDQRRSQPRSGLRPRAIDELLTHADTLSAARGSHGSRTDEFGTPLLDGRAAEREDGQSREGESCRR